LFHNLNLGTDICTEIEASFLDKAILKLKTEMSGYRNILNDAFDPITPIAKNCGFSLQIIVEIGDFDNIVAKCSWHFDRHQEGNLPEFHHPLYHTHFGGKEINKGQLNYGNVLILESPRLLHPPMDIILAVDFVMGNYYSRHNCEPYKALLDEPLYHKLVENSRKRFWQPFFLALASNFTPNKSGNLQHFSSLIVNPTHAQNLLSCAQTQ